MDTVQVSQIITAAILLVSEILPFISIEGNGVFHYIILFLVSLKNVKLPEIQNDEQVKEKVKHKNIFSTSMFHK